MGQLKNYLYTRYNLELKTDFSHKPYYTFPFLQAPWNQYAFRLTQFNSYFTLNAAGQLSTYRSLAADTTSVYRVSISLRFIVLELDEGLFRKPFYFIIAIIIAYDVLSFLF